MDYQVKVLADAIASNWGAVPPGPLEFSEASDLVEWLNEHDYVIVKREPETTLREEDSTGIERALGL